VLRGSLMRIHFFFLSKSSLIQRQSWQTFPLKTFEKLKQDVSKFVYMGSTLCTEILSSMLTFFHIFGKTTNDRRKTIHVGLLIGDDWSGKSSYQPGDHVGVFAVNREEVVNGLMSRLALYRPPLPQGPIKLQFLVEQKGMHIYFQMEIIRDCS